jgi:hypothetical protein
MAKVASLTIMVIRRSVMLKLLHSGGEILAVKLRSLDILKEGYTYDYFW